MFFERFRYLNVSKLEIIALLCSRKQDDMTIASRAIHLQKTLGNMKRNDRTLTKSEFQLMTALWDIGRAACGKEILERYTEPKPTYTTIATYLKILLEKGYVDFFKKEGEGKTQWYVAKITRQEYTRQTMTDVKRNFFGDSMKSMFSYFVKEEKLSPEEIMEMLKSIDNETK